MDLTSKNIIKHILEAHGAWPKKRLGQNFLISRPVLEKIVKAAEIKSEDTILEIGPGIGTLTIELAKRAKRVIAVEKDKKLIEILKETLKGFKNIEIIHGDILKKESSDLIPQTAKYKMVSNLPYYISTQTIRKFLEAEHQPSCMVLLLQKEVAQRICGLPLKKEKMSILSVFVKLYAEPKIVAKVSKESFWPCPQVNSAVIKIVPKKTAVKKELLPLFSKIVKSGFNHPRKQLLNNLSKGLNLEKQRVSSLLLQNNIIPSQRAEDLKLNDWINLTKSFNRY